MGAAAGGGATQVCYRCKRALPLASFIRRVDDRHYRMCRDCVADVLARRTGTLRERLPHTPTHRTCYLCRRLLPNEAFTRRRNGTFFSACKECNRHVFAQRRRARLRDAEGSYTTAQWQALLARYDACPRCGRRWEDIAPPPSGAAVITVDHIVPLAKGGGNGIENLQPLCYSCNSKKGANAY